MWPELPSMRLWPFYIKTVLFGEDEVNIGLVRRCRIRNTESVACAALLSTVLIEGR